MVSDPSDAQALLDAQRRSYLNGAICLVCGLLFHCLVSGELIVPLVLSQLVFIGAFLVLVLTLGRGWLTSTRAGILGGLFGLLSATLFVHWSGGPASPYIHIFGALPFMLALFTPGSSLPTVVSGFTALVATMIVSLLDRRPLRLVVLQSFFGLALLTLAFLGTRLYQRVIHAQRRAHEERLQALERLAESERLRGRAERERAEVERLVLVGQLAAGVAHEVNNPLAFVKANLSYLTREADDPARPLDREELKSLLEETQQGVLRIQQIVTDLKDFSRAGHMGEQEQGDLAESLREAGRLASVRLGGGAEVALELGSALPPVRLGQRHIVQVMVNLLLNAVDAIEQAQPPRRPLIRVRAWRESDHVRVLVEDNGPGIPPEALSRLFEPFFTTKPPGKGTGLGLALCREYVGRVGGTLHAENRAEGGARFILSLPLA